MKNKLEGTQERININSTIRKVGEKDDFKDQRRMKRTQEKVTKIQHTR